jgi:nitric oxide reductase subunit C
MKITALHIFSALCLLFLVYSFSIYIMPMRDRKKPSYNKEMAGKGRLTWQKYNCQACHQLYGLGGYLGPDLTNVYSEPGKGAAWINAIVRSGVKQMPSFELSDQEMLQLVEFMKSTDASGVADPRNFKTQPTGMITVK